ncbi:uncharacterized protein LOC144169277 isoform X3 [Haemaphysalis longicornis]
MEEPQPSGSQPRRAKKSSVLHHFTLRELWGERHRRPSLSTQSCPLARLVPHHVLQSGAVFLGFLSDGQWLLSYVADPDRLRVLPPTCCYLLQWWYFVPGKPLIMTREVPLFGGQSLGAQLRLSVSQWVSNPDWVLVTGYSRLEEEEWHVTLVTKPPRISKGIPPMDCGADDTMHASYSCPSGAQPPQLLGRGRLLLPMGQELLLLNVDGIMGADSGAGRCGAGAKQCFATIPDQSCSASSQSRPGSSHPGETWSSTGVLHPQVEPVHLYIGPPLKTSMQMVLDLGEVADALAPRLCAEHGLAYEALLDYDASAAAGASDGNQATLLLALLVRASRLPANTEQACYIASVLLHWDLNTGRHKVAKLGSVNKAGCRWELDVVCRIYTLVDWLPSWWSLPLDALCSMTNDAVLQGQPLNCLRHRHFCITLN